VLLQVSSNAALLRGAASLPTFLAVEMMAQAALVALPRGESAVEVASDTPRTGVLAGVDALRCDVPLVPGDRLLARATLLGTFGGVVKARVELLREEQVVAEGDLLLSLT